MSVERKEMEEKKGWSRRKFMIGTLAAGGAVAAGLTRVAPAISSSAVTVKVNGKVVEGDVAAQLIDGRTMVPARFISENLGCKVDWNSATRTVDISSQEITFPWPKKIDVEKVRKAGYDGYYQKNGCMWGAAYGLLSLLKEEVGYPWTMIPTDMFKYGQGGNAGWGSLCGAQNGASAIMSMVLGKDALGAVGELNGYYTTAPIPSDKHESYAKFKGQKTTVCKTINCHDSVAMWLDATGFNLKDPEGVAQRDERCAKLTGDVAAKAAELLNAKKIDNNFAAVFKAPAGNATCLTCHEPVLISGKQVGCTTCHTTKASNHPAAK